MSDVRVGSIVYFIIDGRVRSGHLIGINKPEQSEADAGAEPLYEFGHGFATPEVFKTEEEAKDELTKRAEK